MFWFGNKKRVNELEEKTQKGFSDVKDDIDKVGRWIKHLDVKDKQLFDVVSEIKEELSSLRNEIDGLREGLDIVSDEIADKQVFKKLPVLGKQTGVEGVQEAVQTAVQTANFYDIFKELSNNERVLVRALLTEGEGRKLSYEDLALLLGKERSTIRGQINAIKQKSEGLISEMTEKNGKKRVFIPEDVKEKLQKYAKVRVKKK